VSLVPNVGDWIAEEVGRVYTFFHLAAAANCGGRTGCGNRMHSIGGDGGRKSGMFEPKVMSVVSVSIC